MQHEVKFLSHNFKFDLNTAALKNDAKPERLYSFNSGIFIDSHKIKPSLFNHLTFLSKPKENFITEGVLMNHDMDHILKEVYLKEKILKLEGNGQLMPYENIFVEAALLKLIKNKYPALLAPLHKAAAKNEPAYIKIIFSISESFTAMKVYDPDGEKIFEQKFNIRLIENKQILMVLNAVSYAGKRIVLFRAEKLIKNYSVKN